MKGYFIPFGARKIISIDKKINMQIQQLSTIALVKEVDIDIAPKNIFRNILSVLPFIDLPWDYEGAYKEIESPDFIFMRRTGADRHFIKFLKHMKKNFPKCKIVIEIATYPYIKESLRRIDGWVLLPKDLYNRRKIKKYADRIVTYSDDTEIFGVKTIRTMNGINVDEIPLIAPLNQMDTINLIAVACFQPHHGYERCIVGIKNYYESKVREQPRIFLHMVGDGPELVKYKKLVQQYGLEKYIIFYGQLSGEKLNEIYNKADIALGSFGFYKIKLHKSSVLKVREYLSRGFPIVSACQEDVFKNDLPEFYLHFENDDSVIDMNKIIDFYERLFLEGNDKEKLAQKIRNYAKERVDMSVVMKPIIDYLLGEGKR